MPEKGFRSLASHRAAIPSLKGKEIEETAITRRSIARQRHGYGKAIGDILLPEGRAVEVLVKEASAKPEGVSVMLPARIT